MKYIDVHSHLQFEAYGEDREEVFARAKEEGVGLITVGTQKDTSREAIAFAEAHENVWATVGLHPIHTTKSYHDTQELGAEAEKGFTSRGEVFDASLYRELVSHPKVVAIGECGLDYYRLTAESREVQKETFAAQISLANEVGKPLMLHIRNAYKDAYEILKSEAKVLGNVHFFAGTWDDAEMFLNLGYTLSFTGVITFARNYDETVKKAPLSSLLTETDAPYVTPVPHRGKRNEPLHVREVVKKIAEIRGVPEEDVREAVLQNAQRVFGLAERPFA